MPGAKHWCFTLNNYGPNDIHRLEQLASGDSITYLCFGKETGASGTPHLQGYVSFSSRKSRNRAKQAIGSRAHLESAKGSPQQNRDYCSKDGDFTEYGTLPSGQGSRRDLEELKTAIESGCDLRTIQTQFFREYLRYPRAIESMVLRNSSTRQWETQVKVLWGPTGTGKTRKVHEEVEASNLYSHPGGRWFDGYEGHTDVLFDDFGGSEFKITYLLKLLDRYPMRVPIKGGFVQWVPKTIWITSNHHPEEWYQGAKQMHRDALERRLTTVELIE